MVVWVFLPQERQGRILVVGPPTLLFFQLLPGSLIGAVLFRMRLFSYLMFLSSYFQVLPAQVFVFPTMLARIFARLTFIATAASLTEPNFCPKSFTTGRAEFSFLFSNLLWFSI